MSLARKVEKLLSSSAYASQTPDFLTSLQGLSGCFDLPTTSSLHARRTLRTTLQQQAITLGDELVQNFQVVEKELDAVEHSVADLHSQCEALIARLSAAKQQNAEVLAQTSALNEKKREIEVRADAVNSFLAFVQLTPEEHALLDAAATASSPTSSSSSIPMSWRFFDVLAKLQRVRDECRQLMHTHHQRVALDLMDSYAKRLEQGYETLFRWIQQYCRSHLDTSSTSPAALSIQHACDDISPLLTRALQVLQQRPMYYEHCMQEICLLRRANLLRRFTHALTKGSTSSSSSSAAASSHDATSSSADSSSSSRPIDVHAHDPFRYVSDMFAWIHQALALEKDVVMQLLVGDPDTMPPSHLKSSSSSTATITSDSVIVRVIMHRIFDGVFRPLKVRVEQSIGSQASSQPVIAYQLHNLLDFHGRTFAKLLPPIPAMFVVMTSSSSSASSSSASSSSSSSSSSSASTDTSNTTFLATLNYASPSSSSSSSSSSSELLINRFGELVGTLRDEARAVFFSSMQQLTDRLLQNPPPPPYDLSVPPVFADLLHRLTQIMQVHQSSLVTSSSSSADEPDASSSSLSSSSSEFAPVLTAFLEPLLQTLRLSAQSSSSSLDASDSSVYALNVFSAIQATLAPFAFTVTRQETLSAQIELQVEALIKDQATQLLKRCGLAEKLHKWNELKKEQHPPPLSSVPGMDAVSMAEAFKSFYASLIALGTTVTPQCERLLNAALRGATRLGIARLLAATHASFYKAIVAPANGYPQPQATIVLHPPREIALLLDCA